MTAGSIAIHGPLVYLDFHFPRAVYVTADGVDGELLEGNSLPPVVKYLGPEEALAKTAE